MTPVKYDCDFHWVITILMILENEEFNRTDEIGLVLVTADQAVESIAGGMLTWIVWVQYVPVNMHTILL